jgi:GMP synthase PP-ATPase subunit
VAEAERIWKLDNKNKDKLEKQKVIESAKKLFKDNIKTIALQLKVKEDSYQVSTLIIDLF